jgi:hypothetical protein
MTSAPSAAQTGSPTSEGLYQHGFLASHSAHVEILHATTLTDVNATTYTANKRRRGAQQPKENSKNRIL